MNVRERIISIKLYNKAKSNPEITKNLGIDASIIRNKENYQESTITKEKSRR